MESHELMRLLVADNSVKAVSEFTGLTQSLLYAERRESGKGLTATGTRNTIDRLDLFCEFNLDRNPAVVRLVADRYARMYQRHVNPIEPGTTIYDLMAAIAKANGECGQALAALAGQKSLKECTVEIAEARQALEKALAIVTALEEE